MLPSGCASKRSHARHMCDQAKLSAQPPPPPPTYQTPLLPGHTQTHVNNNGEGRGTALCETSLRDASRPPSRSTSATPRHAVPRSMPCRLHYRDCPIKRVVVLHVLSAAASETRCNFTSNAPQLHLSIRRFGCRKRAKQEGTHRAACNNAPTDTHLFLSL